MPDINSGPRGRGRPQTVSPEAVAGIGLDLFLTHGFDETTMSDIAKAAGIGRKTLFTYFPNKADIVWNRFQDQLDDLRLALQDTPADVSTSHAIHAAILQGLHTTAEDIPLMRAEISLIESVPALQSHAYMRGRRWGETIAEFAAAREGLSPQDALPEILGQGFWTAMFVGFRHWIRSGGQSPVPHLDEALKIFSQAFETAFTATK